MKVEMVGDVYFQLIWCRLNRIDRENRPLNEFVVILLAVRRTVHTFLVTVYSVVRCSDQFDPFNRQPLTMDMVQPATELKQQIDSWLAENRQRRHWRFAYY